MTDIAVRYEGAPFALTDVPDADGDRFRVSEVEGLEGMEVELESLAQHRVGSALGIGRYPKREIVVKGIAIAQKTGSNYDALRVRRKIEAWAADYAWGQRWLYIDEPTPGIPVQLKTVPGGQLNMPPSKGRNQDFEVPFTCLDPRKYLQTLETASVNGTATLTNFGNFPTFVFATLSSTRTNPWLQNNTTGNQRITLQGSISAGTTVDFLARRTLVGGTVLQEVAQRPRIWWKLLPGANVITSDGAWTVSWRGALR